MRERPLPRRPVGCTTKVFSYPRLSLLNRSWGRVYFLFAFAAFFTAAFAGRLFAAVFFGGGPLVFLTSLSGFAAGFAAAAAFFDSAGVARWTSVKRVWSPIV